MEVAIGKAGRTKYGYELDIRAQIDKESGYIWLYRYREVVTNLEMFIPFLNGWILMCDSTFSIAPSRDARPAPQKARSSPPCPVKVGKSCGAEQSWFQSIEIRKAITRKDPILSNKYLPDSQNSWFTHFFAPPRPVNFSLAPPHHVDCPTRWSIWYWYLNFYVDHISKSKWREI